jgi:hypothetical protein
VNKQTKQLRIGLLALIIISSHIILCFSFLFFQTSHGAKHGMLSTYRQLALVGPFFTESRIKSTRYLSMRCMNNNRWSDFRNLSQEHLAEYRANPWRWDKLAYVGYERHLGAMLETMSKGRTFGEVKNSQVFRELNGFLVEEFLTMPVDSVQLIGHEVTYIPAKGTSLSDTTFLFTYNPASIGKAKH